MEQSKRTEQEEEQWVKDSRAGCRASKEVQGIGKAMLTIRRRRSTSLWHRRLGSARSSGSRRDLKQPFACPWFTPATKCKLRLLKLDRVKDYLLMEEEFVAGQERLKPHEDKNEEDQSKVDNLRGSSMSVGNLEEIIDENHAIVSSLVGLEYYVNVLSFMDKDQLELGCAILMHNKVFFSFYLVHVAFEKEQWWPDMFARTFLSLPFYCCNCASSCPHDGQPKRLGAMESSISGAISSSFPIEGGELSRMLFTGS